MCSLNQATATTQLTRFVFYELFVFSESSVNQIGCDSLRFRRSSPNLAADFQRQQQQQHTAAKRKLLFETPYRQKYRPTLLANAQKGRAKRVKKKKQPGVRAR